MSAAPTETFFYWLAFLEVCTHAVRRNYSVWFTLQTNSVQVYWEAKERLSLFGLLACSYTVIQRWFAIVGSLDRLRVLRLLVFMFCHDLFRAFEVPLCWRGLVPLLICSVSHIVQYYVEHITLERYVPRGPRGDACFSVSPSVAHSLLTLQGLSVVMNVLVLIWLYCSVCLLLRSKFVCSDAIKSLLQERN